MSNQSSVEWLYSRVLELTLQLSNKRISQRRCELKILKLFEQAKAMHKEEVLSFDTLLHKHEMEALNNNTILLTKEEFYNETFGE